MASFRLQEFGGNIDSVYNPQIFESKIGSKEPKNRLKFNSEKVSHGGAHFLISRINNQGKESASMLKEIQVSFKKAFCQNLLSVLKDRFRSKNSINLF